MNSPDVREQLSRRDSNVFIILLSLYFLILFPILRANRFYNDDLKRALFGRTGWDSNGRPLTTFVMKLLQCYDHALVDISPLPQIGAIAILAWTGVLIARRFDIRSHWVGALVAFPLGAQPFYLENLSYKFDALTMSLALLLALLPIVYLKDDRRGWWLGVVALFASLNFYQSAINAYLIFVLMEFVVAQLQRATPGHLFRRLASRALQAVVGMLGYELIVGIHVNGWVKRKSETIHGLDQLPLIKNNIVDFYTFIGNAFNEQWWMYFGPVLLLLAIVPVVIGVRYAIAYDVVASKWMRALLVAASFLVPVAALVCVLGPMLVLADPPIAPRVLVGVGALLTAPLIVVQAALRRWRRSEKWTVAVGGALALGMCSFASAYGNALGEQKAYEDRIASALADDLAQLKATDSVHAYVLDGTAGYSLATAHVAEQFPLIRTLVPPYLSADDTFHPHIFLEYYVSDTADLRMESDADAPQRWAATIAAAHRMPARRTANAYSLRVVGDTVVVTFRSQQ